MHPGGYSGNSYNRGRRRVGAENFFLKKAFKTAGGNKAKFLTKRLPANAHALSYTPVRL